MGGGGGMQEMRRADRADLVGCLRGSDASDDSACHNAKSIPCKNKHILAQAGMMCVA